MGYRIANAIRPLGIILTLASVIAMVSMLAGPPPTSTSTIDLQLVDRVAAIAVGVLGGGAGILASVRGRRLGALTATVVAIPAVTAHGVAMSEQLQTPVQSVASVAAIFAAIALAVCCLLAHDAGRKDRPTNRFS